MKKDSICQGNTSGMSKVNLMFRAFSDRTRLRILHVLLEGELCVGDIVTILNVPQPKVSRHLAYLRRAGLVAARRNGLWNHYRLASAGSPFHGQLLECLRRCFDAVPEVAKDRAKESKIRRSGGCCPK
jgi:ArsR family transcriptional regulator